LPAAGVAALPPSIGLRAQRMSRIARVAATAVALPGLAAAGLTLRYVAGRRRVARLYDRSGRPPGDASQLNLGAVRTLSVLPLVDWYAARPDLATEPSVSYLVLDRRTTSSAPATPPSRLGELWLL
jgi:hypothetical protein